jgi:hypothetical protein
VRIACEAATAVGVKIGKKGRFFEKKTTKSSEKL